MADPLITADALLRGHRQLIDLAKALDDEGMPIAAKRATKAATVLGQLVGCVMRLEAEKPELFAEKADG